MKTMSRTSPILKGALFLFITLFLTRGGCDRTDIRGTCKIDCQRDTVAIGSTITCRLLVPPDLEGKVHRAHWIVSPEKAGILTYKENNVYGAESIRFTEDRQAQFTAHRAGEAVITVYLFHFHQTSGQVAAIAKLKIVPLFQKKI